MVEVGNRVDVASKAGTRSGVATGVTGLMVRVRWDTGGESSFIPGPGVLSVVSRRSTRASRSTAKKAAPASKAVSEKATKTTTGTTKAAATKTAKAAKAVARKSR